MKPHEPPTLAQALRKAGAAGISRLDAQLLLLHALGRREGDRAWLLAHDDERIAPNVADAFESLCARRAAGEPVAYLLGRKEFFGLELLVDRRVLVPRPETEKLVEWGLELLRGHPSPRVIDLGTGSGAIALALARHLPAAEVEAVDASGDALAVAEANALKLGLPLSLRQADWFSGVSGRYDLVVSNPPYVSEGDEHLAALAHEPASALVAADGGLADLRRIVEQAPARLAPGGWLLLEHGWNQAAAVRQSLADAGFSDVSTRRDLAGIERCSGGRWLERG